jgi:uncharacterized membrane protein YccC
VFVAIEANFIPLLSPSNPMTYDPGQYYNSAIALLSGVALAMLAMRLLPPMSPSNRVRRLLALTLRDLRRLTHGKLPRSSEGWNGRMYGRLSAVPDSIEMLQAARLSAALSLGGDIIRLRHIAGRWGLCSELEAAMAAIGAGNSAAAIHALTRFDRVLADVPNARAGARLRLRARGTILSARESLAQHSSYFDAQVPR